MNLAIVAYTGANANNGSIYFGKSRSGVVGTPGTALVADDRLGQIVFLGDDGTDMASAGARITVAVDGTPGSNDMPGRLIFETTADGASTVTERMRIDSAGGVFIGDSSNNGMTTGLTINQGVNDDKIFALKSSEVAHGYTDQSETDSWFNISKSSATLGGAHVQVIGEDDSLPRVLRWTVAGGTADTTKTTAGVGLVNFDVREHDGANAVANVTADGNVFVVQARVGGATLARFLVDEDGDMYSVTAGQTFDDYDDVALIEAYDHVRSGDAAFEIKSEFGKFAYANEAALIDAGVLGGSIADGGLTNQTQLIRVLTGAARQQATRIRQLETRVSGLLPVGD